MQVPKTMTAKKLRDIADWLDTYDKLAARFIELTRHRISDETAVAALDATQSSEVQDELRLWADEIEAAQP